jgi:hypothetical protein
MTTVGLQARTAARCTPQYAPALREHLCLEWQLADDARERRREREIDRHQRIADRISGLLAELGEPSGANDER